MTDFSKVELDRIDNPTYPDAKKAKAIAGTITHGEKIPLGTERWFGNEKGFAEVSVAKNGKERPAGRFITKYFDDEKDALWELTKCRELAEAGVPVPPTHRYLYSESEKKHMILYSDLTQGGKNKVWSLNNPTEQLQSQIHPTQAELQLVKEKVTEIATKAAEASYLLSNDAYFLIRKETGELEVMVADIGMGVNRSSKEGARRGNTTSAILFFAHIGLN